MDNSYAGSLIPRIALLRLSIKCNKFALSAAKARTYLEGDGTLADARSTTPTMLLEDRAYRSDGASDL